MEPILLVYTYPNHKSLNYSMLQSVLKGLSENKKDYPVSTIDLYQDGFNPSLMFDEKRRRRDLHKDPETEAYRRLVMWADHIVFIYPIWWGRPPAMLLGFFDRVFVSEFAYKYGKKAYEIDKLLAGKKATCISTMKGPTWYPKFFHGNAHKNLMGKAVLKFVGFDQVRFFEFGNMETDTGKQEKALLRVENHFMTV